MESNERYYRRRAHQELAAARRAITADARQRREALAHAYLQRLAALGGEAVAAEPMGEFA
jgi:hypothetical protein